MKFGLCLPIRRDTSLEFNLELGTAAERLGFDSIWVSDHVLIPREMSGRFTKLFYDPIVTLSAIASRTDKIMLGTSVIILPYRNPVVLAKTLSTLDNLSGGRLIMGVAAGWLEEEFKALNVPFNSRSELTDEYLEIITELWESNNPEYNGKFFSFTDIIFEPRPVQKPRPRIWIGGNGGKVLRRAVRYGDCWHPTWLHPQQVTEKIEIIKHIAAEENRDITGFTFSIRNRIDLRKSNSLSGPDRNGKGMFVFHGRTESIRNQVENYIKAGVNYIIFDPETESDKQNLEVAEFISEEIINYFR